MKGNAIAKLIIWSSIALVLICIVAWGIQSEFRFFRFSNWQIPYFDIDFDEGGLYISSDDISDYAAGGGSVKADEISQIELDWVAGKVDIILADTDTIMFEEAAPYALPDDYLMRYSISNGKLKIDYTRQTNMRLIRNIPPKHLTITLPKDLVLSDINIDTVSCDMYIEMLDADEINIEGISNAITIDKLIANNVEISMISGRVELKEASARHMNLSNVSGRIELKSSDIYDLSASTVSGNLYVEPGANVNKVDIDGISGRLTIAIPEIDGFEASYSKISGGLHTDFEVSINNNRAKYKDGGASFNFSTVSGGMYIEKLPEG